SLSVSRRSGPKRYSSTGPPFVTIFTVLPFSTFENGEALVGPASVARSFCPIWSFVSFVYLKRCIGSCMGFGMVLPRLTPVITNRGSGHGSSNAARIVSAHRDFHHRADVR